MFSSFF